MAEYPDPLSFPPLPRREPPTLVGLMGYAGSGKDTVATIMQSDHGFRRLAFADALKRVLFDVNPSIEANPASRERLPLSIVVESEGWEGAKRHHPEVRRMLQALGVAVRQHIDPDTWVNAVMRKIDVDPGRPTVITDVRFPNEALAVRLRGGELWRITRPGFGPVNGHESETALDRQPADRTINNVSSIEALRVLVSDALAR